MGFSRNDETQHKTNVQSHLNPAPPYFLQSYLQKENTNKKGNL
jgi:hypothetical protein